MRKRTPEEIRKLIAQGAGVSRTSIPASAHHVYGYLHLAAALGASAEPVAPMISVENSELNSAAERFGLIMPDNSEARPWFGLNAGAEYGPAKRWPIERFAASALEIKKKTNCRWVLLGGPNDKVFGERIARAIEPEGGHSNCVNLAGRTTFVDQRYRANACGGGGGDTGRGSVWQHVAGNDGTGTDGWGASDAARRSAVRALFFAGMSD
jgi:heptosyltransferase-2